MGPSDAFHTVVTLTPYRVDNVIEALGIASNDTIPTKAVLFMHRVMGDAFYNINIRRADNARLCNEMTFEKIERRYERYRLYKDYFFPKDQGPVDEDALVLAVICDEYVHHINEVIQNPDDPEDTTTRDDGFDSDLVERAQAIWDAANAFETHNELEHGFCEMYGHEAAFLAHINLFQDLDEINADMDEMSAPELRALQGTRLPEMTQHLFTWTAIGCDLDKGFESIKHRVSIKLGISSLPINTL